MDTDPDAYSTHIPILMAAVLRSSGPVIEFGMGHYSTPILHQLCHNRLLLSVESDAEFGSQFSYMKTERHDICFIPDHDWSAADGAVQFAVKSVVDEPWPPLGVVFIDHGDVSQRAKDILRFEDLAEYIVIHDSNVAAYGYEATFPHFKFKYEWMPYVIHTTVLSNFRPFELLQRHGKKVR